MDSRKVKPRGCHGGDVSGIDYVIDSSETEHSSNLENDLRSIFERAPEPPPSSPSGAEEHFYTEPTNDFYDMQDEVAMQEMYAHQDDSLKDLPGMHSQVRRIQPRRGVSYTPNDDVEGDSPPEDSPATQRGSKRSHQRRASRVRRAKKEQIKCNLPCFDEEDDGIPPFCRHELCPLDHRNKFLNLGSQDGGYADLFVKFGNLGFPYFDKRRGTFMGIATISTIMAIFITTYGCLSLAKDKNIILWTYWVKAVAYNTTGADYGLPLKLRDEDAFEVYIGLTSMVQKKCVSGTGCFEHDLSQIEWWKSRDLKQGVDGMDLCNENALLPVFCEHCRDVAVNNISAAFFACATLLFALYGCINRMKFISDCPVQKLLGCLTDSWGALSLAYALWQFQTECLWGLPHQFEGYQLAFVMGPGVYMYTFCMLSSCIRATLHWLTPLPGQGVGCRMVLPTRDKAKETLESLTKWQKQTRQQLEITFNSVAHTTVGGMHKVGDRLETVGRSTVTGINKTVDRSYNKLKMVRSSFSVSSAHEGGGGGSNDHSAVGRRHRTASAATRPVPTPQFDGVSFRRRSSTEGLPGSMEGAAAAAAAATTEGGPQLGGAVAEEGGGEDAELDEEVKLGEQHFGGDGERGRDGAGGGGVGRLQTKVLRQSTTPLPNFWSREGLSRHLSAKLEDKRCSGGGDDDDDDDDDEKEEGEASKEVVPQASPRFSPFGTTKKKQGTKKKKGARSLSRAEVRRELGGVVIGAPLNVAHVMSAAVADTPDTASRPSTDHQPQPSSPSSSSPSSRRRGSSFNSSQAGNHRIDRTASEEPSAVAVAAEAAERATAFFTGSFNNGSTTLPPGTALGQSTSPRERNDRRNSHVTAEKLRVFSENLSSSFASPSMAEKQSPESLHPMKGGEDDDGDRGEPRNEGLKRTPSNGSFRYLGNMPLIPLTHGAHSPSPLPPPEHRFDGSGGSETVAVAPPARTSQQLPPAGLVSGVLEPMFEEEEEAGLASPLPCGGFGAVATATL